MTADDPAEAATLVVDALERAGMKCAIGGSLALGLWGVPRGTKDADVNAFVEPARYAELQRTLEAAGLGPAPDRASWTPADRERFVRQCEEGEAAVAYRAGIRVDIFVPSIPFYEEAARSVRRVMDAATGRTVPVLGAETLAVFKLLFFRDKDLVDLRRLVARQKGALDRAWVRAQLAAMFPGGDERLDAWDAIVRDHG